MIKHKHHLIPRHRGGNDDPSNLVEVTINQHIMFHWCEYQRLGLKEDLIAYKFLSGSHPGGWNEGLDRPEHSQRMTGRGNPMFGLKGKEHPSHGHRMSEERKERLRDRMNVNNPMDNPESRKKISDKRRGVPTKVWNYLITFDDGREEIVTNLKSWCKENGYTSTYLFRLKSGLRTTPYRDIVSVSRI